MSRPATLEEFADRFEIDELLNRYVTALDDDQFEMLDTVFTQDAHLSYADAGIEGDFVTVRDTLAAVRPASKVWLHLVGNRRVSVRDDRAQSISTFFFVGVSHEGATGFTGGEYHDEMVRTPDGWRISERIERQLWTAAGSLGGAPPS
jgi:hypothetical protein